MTKSQLESICGEMRGSHVRAVPQSLCCSTTPESMFFMPGAVWTLAMLVLLLLLLPCSLAVVRLGLLIFFGPFSARLCSYL